jgi:DNA-binding NarL/FixJ family response regulator
MQVVKVIIADDHQLFSDSLKLLLTRNESFDFEVLETVNKGELILESIKKYNPNILFLDLNMPGSNNIELIPILKLIDPEMKILVISSFEEVKIIKNVFKKGADGYLLKSANINELISGVTAVLKGDIFTSEGINFNIHTSSFGLKDTYEDSFSKKFNLTKRELEIMLMITKAKNNKQIAKDLYISDQTVAVHRKNIMRKLYVTNTAGLVKIVYDNNLL